MSLDGGFGMVVLGLFAALAVLVVAGYRNTTRFPPFVRPLIPAA